MNHIKLVDRINKSSSWEQYAKVDLLIQAQEGIVSLNDIYVEVEECWEKYEVLHFENLEVFFYPELCIIMEKESPQKISVKPYEEKINFNKVIINKKTI